MTWGLSTLNQSIGTFLEEPGIALDYARGGRTGVFRKLVSQSISELRRVSPPNSPEDLIRLPPTSILGRKGAPQELLYLLTRTLRPDRVVETGVFRGLSSAFILAALEDNQRGRLYSIDLPHRSGSTGRVTTDPGTRLRANEEPGFAVPPTLKSRWELSLGDSNVLLPKILKELGEIDIFFHDSLHTYENMMWEYRTSLPYLSSAGMLTSDDVHLNTAFHDFIMLHDSKWSAVARGRLGFAIFR